MVRYQQIGYSPELYQVIEQVAFARYPHEMYRDDHPAFQAKADREREDFRKNLIAGLIGKDDQNDGPGLAGEYLEVLYEAIDDDDLRALIEFGTLDELHFDQHGYYLAIIE